MGDERQRRGVVVGVVVVTVVIIAGEWIEC